MKRILIAICPAMAALICACVTTMEDGGTGNEPKHLRVIWEQDPQTKAIVSWSTDGEAGPHMVHFDTKSRGGSVNKYRSKISSGKDFQFDADPKSTNVLYGHHAYLKDLPPGERVYFVVRSGRSVSEEYHFDTAPAEDVEFSIIFGGDSRTRRDARRAVNERIAVLAEGDPSILALAHGGDYVNSGRSLEQQIRWLEDHELTFTSEGRILPIIPTYGNHEAANMHDQIFAEPGGVGKRYFTTMLSPEVSFVTLNNCIDVAGEQKEFLEAQLKKASGLRWSVVQYHKPIYAAVKGPHAAAKEHWVPLFEEYGVALACEADGHCIKRSVPIFEDKQDDKRGVVYIGEGGMGAPQRNIHADRWFIAPLKDKNGKGDHVHVLKFGKKTIGVTVVLVDGKIFDSFEVTRPQR